MVAEGAADWFGLPPRLPDKTFANPGRATADLVIEDREPRLPDPPAGTPRSG